MSMFSSLFNRNTVPIYQKIETIESGNSVVNAKRKKEKGIRLL